MFIGADPPAVSASICACRLAIAATWTAYGTYWGCAPGSHRLVDVRGVVDVRQADVSFRERQVDCDLRRRAVAPHARLALQQVAVGRRQRGDRGQVAVERLTRGDRARLRAAHRLERVGGVVDVAEEVSEPGPWRRAVAELDAPGIRLEPWLAVGEDRIVRAPLCRDVAAKLDD
jgi:hypothetical protein